MNDWWQLVHYERAGATNGDDIVNLPDFAVLAAHWLEIGHVE